MRKCLKMCDLYSEISTFIYLYKYVEKSIFPDKFSIFLSCWLWLILKVVTNERDLYYRSVTLLPVMCSISM